MQTVNVNCVEVFPCAYWKGLIRLAEKQQGPTANGFEKSTWPPHSSLLCWHCCHSFDSVPAYYPIELNFKKNMFYFMGNFCSWNCVKGYALKVNDHRKPQGTTFISLLAFLTVHRPKYCLQPRAERHSYQCPCIDMFRGVPLPPKKELLESFGGTMSISDYRKNFLTIDKYEWVMEYFHKNNNIIREMDSITSTQKRRAYTFCFISYPGPSEATVDQLYLLPLTHKTLPKTQKPENEDPPPATKRALKSCTRSNPGGRRRFPKSAALAPPTQEVQSESKQVPESTPEPPIRVVEPVVSEEQAFYISSIHKYGNLMSSMGITIEKKSSIDGR